VARVWRSMEFVSYVLHSIKKHISEQMNDYE
jgi:hypothetical protein